MTCETCRHVHVGDGGVLICRRYPPTTHVIVEQARDPLGRIIATPRVLTMWPQVRNDTTCGEHRIAIGFATN